MGRQLDLIKAKKQYYRYPGLIPIIKLENFLKHNPRFKTDIPYKTIDAIIYSVGTKPINRDNDVWQIVKRCYPPKMNWDMIAAYGNSKTLNIRLIDYSILYNDEEFILNYPHIQRYLLNLIKEII